MMKPCVLDKFWIVTCNVANISLLREQLIPSLKQRVSYRLTSRELRRKEIRRVHEKTAD